MVLPFIGNDNGRVTLISLLQRLFFTTKLMSDSYFNWLKYNSFWRQDALAVKPSEIGGTGVFATDPDTFAPDTILLRVPKSNILSNRNSSIYSLLVEYQETRPEVDLSTGMFSLIIVYVYEDSVGSKSPWYDYLRAINPTRTNIDVPLSLWNSSEKNLLVNSECGILGMLESEELESFFKECVRFFNVNKSLLEAPRVFDVDLESDYHDNLTLLGTYAQTVLSRFFDVDNYHGPALVPGADLFNHLSPVFENEILVERENVHFVCDDDVCVFCGDLECDHQEEDNESNEEDEVVESIEEPEEYTQEFLTELIRQFEEDSESSDEDGEELSGEEFSEGELSEGEFAEDEILEGDVPEGEVPEGEVPEGEVPEGEVPEGEVPEGEIPGEENSEDDFENFEDENSENEDSENENSPDEVFFNPFNTYLNEELNDPSKCVDIVVAQPPSQKYDYEIFITYGNDLSDPFLANNYHFVNKSPCVTNTIHLSRQLKKYIKALKVSSTPEEIKQIEHKLTWLENSFPTVCEVVQGYFLKCSQNHKPVKKTNKRKRNGDYIEIPDEDDDEEITRVEFNSAHNYPEKWQTSVKVLSDGSITYYGILIVRLLLVSFDLFKKHILECKDEISSQIERLLLSDEFVNKDKVTNIINGWIKDRKNSSKLNATAGNKERLALIDTILKNENLMLSKARA